MALPVNAMNAILLRHLMWVVVGQSITWSAHAQIYRLEACACRCVNTVNTGAEYDVCSSCNCALSRWPSPCLTEVENKDYCIFDPIKIVSVIIILRQHKQLKYP
jgi:hypothetical protein